MAHPQAAAVPVLTGLRFFRDEFVCHAADKTCPTRACAMRGEPVILNKKISLEAYSKGVVNAHKPND